MRYVTIKQICDWLREFWHLSVEMNVGGEWQEVYHFTRQINRAIELFVDIRSQDEYTEEELKRFLRQSMGDEDIRFTIITKSQQDVEIKLRK